jgi:hypothetical protein
VSRLLLGKFEARFASLANRSDSVLSPRAFTRRNRPVPPPSYVLLADRAGSIHSDPIEPSRRRGGLGALTLGALGVVFGDIGTSPLYAIQTVFTADHHRVKTSPVEVYGVISLVFWACGARKPDRARSQGHGRILEPSGVEVVEHVVCAGFSATGSVRSSARGSLRRSCLVVLGGRGGPVRGGSRRWRQGSSGRVRRRVVG